jgi:FAD/FMN-containing dehydrogenase
VLLKISHTGKNWRDYEVHGDGSSITVQPGLIGGEVNRILAAHQRRHKLPIQYKLGPDPASIGAPRLLLSPLLPSCFLSSLLASCCATCGPVWAPSIPGSLLEVGFAVPPR